MIVVFDTNVFLQDHYNLWELVDHFPVNQEPPEFFVAVDRNGEIENDYLAHKEQLVKEELYAIVQRILDGTALFVVRPQVHLPNILKNRLWDCKPIEPQLFCVAAGTQGVLVTPNSSKELPIPRTYTKPEVLARIQANGVGPCVLSLKETLKLIREPHEYSPEDLAELKIMIGRYALGSKKSEEREFLEFKNPKNDCLTTKQLREAVQAVCAMLNTRDGYVIIGIDNETGGICPFTPRYGAKPEIVSADHVVLCIAQEINRILPTPGKLVHVWPLVDDSNQKCVFVIHVKKGNHEYVYRDEEKNGWKLGAVKWIRDKGSTIPDPDWHPQCSN